MGKDLSNSRKYRYNRITFYLNGKCRMLDLPPGISTLNLVNKVLHLYGSKCSCNEGDCGACTMVIAYPREGTIVYEAITSCLYPAAKLHGKHLITVEGLGSPEHLHPIQQALLDHHATQCGYCTPGFVMSLFALLISIPHPDKEQIMAALEGNLCRCTGYQSILEAALELSENQEPLSILPDFCRQTESKLFGFKEEPAELEMDNDALHPISFYHKASSVEDIKKLMTEHPQARLIAGGTDIMVQINISRTTFRGLIDLGDIPELRQIHFRPDGIHIGAGVTYSQLMDSGIIKSDLPELARISGLIASLQIRNFATLAGNVANASPIGDSLPLLLVYEARLLLDSPTKSRELPLQDYFLDYHKVALQPGEFIREIIIPVPPRDSFIGALKSSKRKAVDISSVVSALRIDKGGKALLAFGGVAAIPRLSGSFSFEGTKAADWHQIANAVAARFEPLSDLRGSADYRKQMIISHILQYREAYHG